MFTKAEFLSNEDNNYHTENGVEMAREFGTEEELKLMLQIQSDHYARGHIQPDEIEARRGIVNKYWKHLEKVGSVTDSIEEDEERGADFYREAPQPGCPCHGFWSQI
jgi:protein-disulfide isomerase-like protein with CxxC motif